jgi:hypothetical protein
MGRKGTGGKQLLNDLKEMRKLKKESLDHTFWRTHFGRRYEPIIRQTTR